MSDHLETLSDTEAGRVAEIAAAAIKDIVAKARAYGLNNAAVCVAVELVAVGIALAIEDQFAVPASEPLQVMSDNLLSRLDQVRDHARPATLHS